MAVPWDPSPRVDEGHVLPLIPEAVPCVSVEGASLVVERGVVGIRDPVASEEVTGVGD